ncbi:hypothetical protein [Aliarcobacter vitoriensis]|uniref:Uncharacterized protein n=1 Tax=Aliarcobacter vitoriensis TaxID=2011099 RepID=A0A366MQA2_9BACT|nr:hypothetical protein [Aliarcobacter vitoriensis]RBQ28415.1 hypothetical protein CRU91_09345 [Aliarcobacter vitoriensis]
MITEGQRYIGGGKLFFTENKIGASEIEIGEIQEASLNVGVETAEAFSKDNTMKKLVEKVPTNITGSLKFTTQKINLNNMAMAMLGTLTDEEFDIGEVLPDGTTATTLTTVPVIKIGEKPIIEGQFRFVGDEDGAFKPVLVVFNAAVTPSGELPYITDNFATLSFEGAVLKTDNGYAKEYRMKVGA